MGLRPLGDRVLIKPAKSPNETASGLLLPEDRAEQYAEMQGTVIAVGTPRHPLKDDAEDLASRLRDNFVIDDQFKLASTLLSASDLLCDLVRREPCVNVGDDVLFSWSVGQKVTVDDEEYLLMRESDLLAVLESEPS